MFALRYTAGIILILAAALGFFIYKTSTPTYQANQGRFAFKLGLDLSGGTELVYDADTSKVPAANVNDSLTALQAVIERRVNAFGVSEPQVQLEQGGALGTGVHRLIVDLPGVTDVNQAIKSIGQTPTLDFMLVKPGFEASTTNADGTVNLAAFTDTGLTGEYLSSASLQFGNGTGAAASEPVVEVNFNQQGAKLFSTITDANVGRVMGIFLDGQLIEAPTIQQKIDGGTAVISGNFTAQTAKDLATNLNLGALPVPITLDSTDSIGPTLGAQATRAGVFAGVLGFIILSIFMILWYRLPGVVSVVSLLIYSILMLTLFKVVPVVLTSAGIAAFILSIGLAVDANVLIAERMKEELADGKETERAIRDGFARAWTAIRDSNIAHLIAAVILFWLGTSIIKGFALVFGLGVLISLISAITISRTFMLAIGLNAESGVGRFLMRSGLRK
ncbi:MAG TPA: protein translocase subunit SecD [Candidatus Paceibacterota bacterium]|nr:protein translocase subunit SecD [Candidatus Paceibacterota bacterium]